MLRLIFKNTQIEKKKKTIFFICEGSCFILSFYIFPLCYGHKIVIIMPPGFRALGGPRNMDSSSEYCPGLKVEVDPARASAGGLMGPEAHSGEVPCAACLHTHVSPSQSLGMGLPQVQARMKEVKYLPRSHGVPRGKYTWIPYLSAYPSAKLRAWHGIEAPVLEGEWINW